MKMNVKMKVVLVVIAIVSLIVIAYAAYPFVVIRNIGVVEVVGVNADVDFIDWGLIEPSSTTAKLINIMPNGTIPITLTVNTTNWNPSIASDYMTLSWNYTGVALQPDIWCPIELYLTVSPNIESVKNFSFDIIIIGVSVDG